MAPLDGHHPPLFAERNRALKGELRLSPDKKYIVCHLKDEHIKVYAPKARWWTIIPEILFLPALILSVWNHLLFRIGIAKITIQNEIHEVKIAAIRDKFFLQQEVIKKAIAQNNLTETIEDSFAETIIDQGKESWIRKILAKYDLKKNGNHTDTLIKFRVDPSQLDYYVELQKEIAALIPKEWNRPTIEIEISRSTESITHTYCVAGGAGPLSDAAIIDQAVTLINQSDHSAIWEGVRIILFSSPPPMRGLAQFTNLTKLYPWWTRIQEFFSRWKERYEGSVHYILASNTGHVYMPKLNPLVQGRIQHIVHEIAHGLKLIHACNVLILGTTEAYLKSLYPKVLKTVSIPFFNVERKDQNEIQKIINKMKENKLEQHQVEKLKEIITEYCCRELKPTHLLLSCTELPMALHGESEFKKEIESKGIKIINTEEVFARQIALNVINRSSRSNEKNALETMVKD